MNYKKIRNIKNSKNAEVWVSAILYILIITLVIVLILKTAVPIIEKMKDRSSFNKAKESMLTIDKTISEVANEGEGSQRIVPVDVKDGKIIINNNEISWEIETKTEVLDERSSVDFGNLKISSNANVKALETENSYIMQTTIDGDIFNVSVKKIGLESNYSAINTTSIIESVYYDGQLLDGEFNFLVNGDEDSSEGNGYTKMIPAGNNTGLGRAKVLAHVNNSDYEYDLELTLESYADFLTVELKNVKFKG